MFLLLCVFENFWHVKILTLGENDAMQLPHRNVSLFTARPLSMETGHENRTMSATWQIEAWQEEMASGREEAEMT